MVAINFQISQWEKNERKKDKKPWKQSNLFSFLIWKGYSLRHWLVVGLAKVKEIWNRESFATENVHEKAIREKGTTSVKNFVEINRNESSDERIYWQAQERLFDIKKTTEAQFQFKKICKWWILEIYWIIILKYVALNAFLLHKP